MLLGRNLNEILKSRYGIDLLEGDLSAEHLIDVYEHYNEKRMLVKEILGESCITESSQYSKAFLISETARMILREIAPKRTKKKKGNNS